MAVIVGNASAPIPAAANSVEQPVVKFLTTAAIVSLLQAGEPHMLVNQPLRG